MKTDIKITKMYRGTYKAWVKVRKKEVREYEAIIDADGNTPEEAECNLLKKL